MAPLSDKELDERIHAELENTPAYSMQLVMFQEDREAGRWNARVADVLGTCS